MNSTAIATAPLTVIVEGDIQTIYLTRELVAGMNQVGFEAQRVRDFYAAEDCNTLDALFEIVKPVGKMIGQTIGQEFADELTRGMERMERHQNLSYSAWAITPGLHAALPASTDEPKFYCTSCSNELDYEQITDGYSDCVACAGDFFV